MKKETPLKHTLSVIIILSALIGSYRTIFIAGEISDNDFFYFTIQSNLWIAALHIYFLFSSNRGKFTRILHFMLTVSISITLIVFFLVLVPELGLHVVSLAGSIETHLIVPIAAIFYFIRFEDSNDFKSKTVFYPIILPLIYVILIFILSAFGMTFISDNPVPYFFLNYEVLGWFRIGNGRMGVVYWVVALAILVVFIGAVILMLNRRFNKVDNR